MILIQQVIFAFRIHVILEYWIVIVLWDSIPAASILLRGEREGVEEHFKGHSKVYHVIIVVVLCVAMQGLT